MNKIILSRQDQLALRIIEDLNKPRGFGVDVGLKTRLHSGQIDALKYFYHHKYRLLVQPCGRKFGKTEEAGYFLWKHALENPMSACYYVAPEGNHGRKIVWDTHRLQRFLGEDTEKYVKSIKNLEMKVELKNGSFIQVIGSENYGAANGLTPDAAVYDEFKLFHPRWHIDFAPNLVAKAAPLLIIGTYPTPGDRNYDQYFEVVDVAKRSDRAMVIEKTTFDNPINHLPDIKAAIEFEIDQLRSRGEEDIVQREYYSKIVPGGKRAIFPMLNRVRHTAPHATIVEEIRRDLKKLEWYCIADPGSTTCFATLFAAINPYTRKVYILDELYEKDQNMTSTRMVYPRMDQKMMELFPNSDVDDDWVKGFDEAAAWFSNEVMQQYGVYFMPTQKHLNKKEHGLSLIKDLLVHDLAIISDRCVNLLDEMEKYAKDDKGNIPKSNDHLIDAFRYLLAFANYNMLEVLELRKQTNDMERGRFRRMVDDPYLKEDVYDDWTLSLDTDMFD